MVPVRREMLCKIQEEEGALSIQSSVAGKSMHIGYISWASFMTKSATSVQVSSLGAGQRRQTTKEQVNQPLFMVAHRCDTH